MTALPSECANWMYWLGANVSKRWEQDGSTMGAGDLVAVRAGVRTGGVKPPLPPSTLPQSALSAPAVTNSSILLVWFKVQRRVVVCCSSATL